MASDGSCQLCGKNCVQCSGPDQCGRCREGMAIIDGECKLCAENCADCDMQTTMCLRCNSRFYPSADGRQCLPCLQGCFGCTGPTEQECTLCDLYSGYIGVNGQHCRHLVDTCSDIRDFTDQGIHDYNRYCLGCTHGYYAVGYGQYDLDCVRCQYPCMNCQSSTECTRCALGSFMSNGRCYPCPDDCTDCITDNKCIVCTDGLPPVNGSCSKERKAISDPKLPFFFSFRVQTKIVWLIIFAELLMLIIRVCIKLFEHFSNIIYERRVAHKKSLRLMMALASTSFTSVHMRGHKSKHSRLSKLGLTTPSPAHHRRHPTSTPPRYTKL